jgi:branched-chain amino acid transport system substrate-binding protein
MKNKILVAFCAALLSLLSSEASASPDVMNLGVMVCLSGDCAQWGANSLKGIQLAQEEINKDGGILGHRVELKIQDTKEGTSGSGAVTAFKNLTNDPSIKYFIGPTWTSGGLTVGPIAKNMNIIVTSPSLGVKEFNEYGDNLFNVWPHDEASTEALAAYAFQHGLKRVGILSSQQPWSFDQGHIFERSFKKLGGEITRIEEPLPLDTNVRPEVLRIKASNPQAILFTDYGGLVGGAKLFRELKFQPPFLFPVDVDQAHIEAANGALEGLILTRYQAPSSEFRSKFKARFNEEPAVTADKAYDLMYLYRKAITGAQSFEPSKVKSVLARTQIDGVSGPISFDEKRAVQMKPSFYRIHGLEKTLEQ